MLEGVSLAESQGGGKYLIRGGLMCRYKGKNYEIRCKYD
jgi:hypothetical protein